MPIGFIPQQITVNVKITWPKEPIKITIEHVSGMTEDEEAAFMDKVKAGVETNTEGITDVQKEKENPAT